MPFHNPYHFVPIGKIDQKDEYKVEDFRKRQFASYTNVTHDRYVEGTHSGRIVCDLITESPILIGSEVVEKADPRTKTPAKIGNFELDGFPAIPATTIRGLFSSIIEAATGSVLRVLEKDLYSYRQRMSDALSALGMVVKGDSNGEWKLRPLTLPVLLHRDGFPMNDQAGMKAVFKSHNTPNLKVYLSQRSCGSLDTYSAEKDNYYYLRLQSRTWTGDREVSNDGSLYLSARGQILGQKARRLNDRTNQPENDPYPTPKLKNQIPNGQEADYVRGIVRIMSHSKRDFPRNRHYEVFIPYPVGEAENWETFPIRQEAIHRFQQIANQRTKETQKGADDVHEIMPYHPRGTKRNTDSKKFGKNLVLKEGDIVFFRPSNDGSEIVEISFSSIWRERVNKRYTTSHDFFNAIDPAGQLELVPFHKDRKVITLAERMLGFVSSDSDDALAGRIFPSNGLVMDRTDWKRNSGDAFPYCDEVTLRILASPKPPSPSMYFKMSDGTGAYIAKNQLKPGCHHPNGRKFYLHHSQAEIENKKWKTGRTENELVQIYKQVARINPIPGNTTFRFHIDFDNLTDRELGALLYALRPTEQFRHKVGMGKPIGLGQVKIEPIELELIDRKFRYNDLTSERYNKLVWRLDPESGIHPFRTAGSNVPDPDELDQQEVAAGTIADPNPHTIYSDFANSIDETTKKALELIGDTSSVTEPVHYPTVKVNGTEQDPESETYVWFVANDLDRPRMSFNGQPLSVANPRTKFLEPLTENSTSIPALEPHILTTANNQGQGGGHVPRGNNRNRGRRRR